jgi:hypothetical protein
MPHIHHPVARSRGGDNFYTEVVDPYDHCYNHAIDYLLFDNAPRFDFRHEAWTLLPEDLREKVLEKAREDGKKQNFLTPEGRSRGGRTRGQQCIDQKEGVLGRSPEQMTADGRKGGKLGGKTQGQKNAEKKTGFCNPEVQSRNARMLNSKRVQCTQTGHISTPGGLARYQQSRGIDHTNPANWKAI